MGIESDYRPLNHYSQVESLHQFLHHYHEGVYHSIIYFLACCPYIKKFVEFVAICRTTKSIYQLPRHIFALIASNVKNNEVKPVITARKRSLGLGSMFIGGAWSGRCLLRRGLVQGGAWLRGGALGVPAAGGLVQGGLVWGDQFRISPHRPNAILGIENRVKKRLFP